MQSYAAMYTGYTKMKRLVFIGEKGPTGLALEALRMAADEVKGTDNTSMYTEARFGPLRLACPSPRVVRSTGSSLPLLRAPAALPLQH